MEVRHHVRVRLAPDFSRISQYVSNFHIDHGSVDQEDHLDLLRVKVLVQSILHGQLFFTEGLLTGIIGGLVLLPALRMQIVQVLPVNVGARGRLEVIRVLRARSPGSNLCFLIKEEAEQALS